MPNSKSSNILLLWISAVLTITVYARQETDSFASSSFNLRGNSDRSLEELEATSIVHVSQKTKEENPMNKVYRRLSSKQSNSEKSDPNEKSGQKPIALPGMSNDPTDNKFGKEIHPTVAKPDFHPVDGFLLDNVPHLKTNKVVPLVSVLDSNKKDIPSDPTQAPTSGDNDLEWVYPYFHVEVPKAQKKEGHLSDNYFKYLDEETKLLVPLDEGKDPTKLHLERTPGIGCAGDVELLEQRGAKSLMESDPIHDAIVITKQDMTSVTVDLYQVWENPAGYPIKSFYYHFHKPGKRFWGSSKCYEETDVFYSDSTKVDTIEIACNVSRPYAKLEVCLVDDDSHGSLILAENSSWLVPDICNHKISGDTETATCYTLEISCVPRGENIDC